MSFHKYLKKEEPVEASPLLSQEEEADWKTRSFDPFGMFGIPNIQMRNTGRIQSDQLEQPKDRNMYLVDRDPYTGLETKTLLETTPLPDYRDVEYRDDKYGDDEKEHLGTGVYEDELGNYSITREMYDGSIAELSVGSTLKFADDADFPYLTPGKEYTVCEVDCDGDVYVTGDTDDSMWVDPSEFNWVSHG